jgi:hypothetical protein
MIPIHLKDGVRLRGMTPQALLVVTIAAPIWEEYGVETLVITSGTDGKHSTGSYHHTGDGIDLRSRDIDDLVLPEIVQALQKALGTSYDVIQETTHIHVEYEG